MYLPLLAFCKKKNLIFFLICKYFKIIEQPLNIIIYKDILVIESLYGISQNGGLRQGRYKV